MIALLLAVSLVWEPKLNVKFYIKAQFVPHREHSVLTVRGWGRDQKLFCCESHTEKSERKRADNLQNV